MKSIALIFVLLIAAGGIYAQDSLYTPPPTQEKPKAPIKDKIYYGGYVNLSFGSYTVVGIEPMIAYKLKPKLSVGLKINYTYTSSNYSGTKYTSSSYGGSIFARYRVIPPLYAHVEYAAYNYEFYNSLGESTREWVPFLFVGAGYSQKMGGRAWLNFQILFDVLQSSKSPYNDWEPFYSIGVGVGF